MPAVHLFFTFHPPVRLKAYPALEIGLHTGYPDLLATYDLWSRLTASSYLPGLRLLTRLAREGNGKFVCSLYVPGFFWEQAGIYAPEVQNALRELHATGCVEWLGGPYYPTLAFVMNPREFERQVEMQEAWLEREFGSLPAVLLNTDLLYHHLVGFFAFRAGYKAVIAEGNPRFMADQAFNHLGYPAHRQDLPVLIRHPYLSEDISHRFGDTQWQEFPIDAARFAGWLATSGGEVVSLGLPFETLGYHQAASTGVFDFFSDLPGQILRSGLCFETSTHAATRFVPSRPYGGEDYIHWLDRKNDMHLWRGTSWQHECLELLYALEEQVLMPVNQHLLSEWRWLQLADHLLFMHETQHPEGMASLRNGPFKSAADAYICFSNALSDFRIRLK